MGKFLDLAGLARVWAAAEDKFAAKDAATQSTAGLMSASDKSKLDGLDAAVAALEARLEALEGN